MDSNGTSPQWSCRVQAADVRGALLEEVMHRHDLVAIFRSGNRDEKDLDVTLITFELEALACDWTSREGWTTADHRRITFHLSGRERVGVSRILRLTDLKKGYNKARRRFQREREPELKSSLKLRSDLLRRRYARACWKARNAKWQKLIRQSTSSKSYGFIYKMTSDKIAPKAALSTLIVGDSRTSGWAETAEAMLDSFFADPVRPDRLVPPSRKADVEPCTELEVLKAVETMKSVKCPGEDRIEADMVI
ncbi:unnamed protein product [Trichogramma brassicae]|uniref:Endonuclease/exonuclease/phosphatase domain-containing protein n=1 Tax=Trichogramma brassicae TaxID=86971 RepID=A0A6H5I8Q0_9HYME|nr:unnamed protein product [Trichogramma brassicae]